MGNAQNRNDMGYIYGTTSTLLASDDMTEDVLTNFYNAYCLNTLPLNQDYDDSWQ